MADAKKKPEVLHRKKLFGGRWSAKEVHRALVFGGHNCFHCGSNKPAIRITSFAPALEVARSDGGAALLAKLALENDGMVPIVTFTYGKFIRIRTVYACDNCKRDAEKAAAKHPEGWLVEIDRGPTDDKPAVQVH